MLTLSPTLTSDAASRSSKEDAPITPDSKTFIFDIVRDFIHRLQWVPLPNDVDAKLETAVLATISSWDVNDQVRKGLEKAAPVAICMSSLSYAHEDDFERKLFIAIVDLCLIYVDNTAHANFKACEEFSPRILARQDQLHPVLKRLATLLPRFPDYYEPFAASMMTLSICQFVSACCIEDRANGMVVSYSATEWPWALRLMTGVVPVFSYAIFPRAMFPDVTAYLQAMPDIERFINLANDVLSFYKEEMAHETANYIHNVSLVRALSPTQVLIQCTDEAISAHDRATRILSEGDTSGDLLVAWKTFVRGYIAFHMQSSRYLLAPHFQGELDT